MNIKDELLKFRTKIVGIDKERSSYKIDFSNTLIDLDDKVDAFIRWYYENSVKGNYTDIGEYHVPIEMKNLIEKIAVWYELRYPDYEINRLMHCCGQEEISINDIMFKENNYINDVLGEKSDIKKLDWNNFYNTNVFIKSLPWDERRYFSEPMYKDIVYLNPNYGGVHLHLTKSGFVEMSEGMTIYTKSIIKDEELQGMHIREVVDLFRKKGIELPENNELEKTIKYVDNWIYQKDEILNCVMYRIIERGGNRIGPRRAFLFAKEFGRNIDVPMMYAVDYSDPGLRLFMNEYIKAGGSKNLKCYVGYFYRTNKTEKLDTVSVQDLILTQNNDAVSFYTSEEHELHQKLANAIANLVNQEVVKQEEVKKLGLQRK